MQTPKMKVYVPEKTFQWRFEATVETYMVFKNKGLSMLPTSNPSTQEAGQGFKDRLGYRVPVQYLLYNKTTNREKQTRRNKNISNKRNAAK